jgi:hypothetical protein
MVYQEVSPPEFCTRLPPKLHGQPTLASALCSVIHCSFTSYHIGLSIPPPPPWGFWFQRLAQTEPFLQTACQKRFSVESWLDASMGNIGLGKSQFFETVWMCMLSKNSVSHFQFSPPEGLTKYKEYWKLLKWRSWCNTICSVDYFI